MIDINIALVVVMLTTWLFHGEVDNWEKINKIIDVKYQQALKQSPTPQDCVVEVKDE